jgi:protocatechuate 3,4-dioxygenase beta subunit
VQRRNTGAAVNLTRKSLGAFGLLFGAYLLWCVFAVHAQSGARLTGTVLDVSGGIIPGADVILFSDDRVLTTKANQGGLFQFVLLPPNARYIEASSPGFASVSIAFTDKVPEQVSFTLSPGSFSGPTPLCSLPSNLPLPSASYEERRGNAHLAGSVTEPSGTPLADTSLTLSKADLDTHLEIGPHPYGLSMRKRARSLMVIGKVFSNAKGEFQFVELEPGWYTLKAARDGYSSGFVEFWVARENLTRISRIYLQNCR